MPGRKVSKYKSKKAAAESRKEREARIAREKRKARNAREVKAAVSSRVSYVKKPFAKNSLYSVGLAAVGLLLFVAGIAGSVQAEGQAGLTAAALEVCSLLMCVAAVWYGFRSFQEKDKNYILARIGIVVSAILILLWFIMIIIGMRG